MVRIRLRRVGAKKQPSYRVVVTDQRSPRDGRFIEIIGNYNPRTEPPTVVIKDERARYWLARGAQPSEAVARMLTKLEITGKPADPEAEAVVEGQVESEDGTEPVQAEESEPVAEAQAADAEPEASDETE